MIIASISMLFSQSTQAVGRKVLVESVWLEGKEAQKRLRLEIDRLRESSPAAFKHKSVDKTIDTLFLYPDEDGYLLFAAVDVVHQDLEKFYQEFPVLAYIAELIFIGDMDGDKNVEIVGGWTIESNDRRIYVFKQTETGISCYTHQFTSEVGQRIGISVCTVPNGAVRLVGSVKVEGRLPVRGNPRRKIPYESLYETQVRFTGDGFETVDPMRLIRQEVILDE